MNSDPQGSPASEPSRGWLRPGLTGARRRWRAWKLTRWSIRLVGLIVLAFVLRQVDFNQVGEALKSLRPWPLVGAILLTVPFFLVKSWRWRLILRQLGIHISNREATQLYGVGLFVGQATPGQLGEMVRAHFLWRKGHDPIKSAGSVVVDRVLDSIALALFVVAGVMMFMRQWALAALLLALLLAVCALFVPWANSKISRFTAKLKSRPRLQHLVDAAQRFVITFPLSMCEPKAAVLIVGATLLSSALNFLRFYLLLAALGLSLPVAHFIFGVSWANFAGLLPVTIFGVGLREAVLVQVFQDAGQTAEGAIAFSALILAAYLLNIVWGFGAWLLETR
ncbi:MAG: flippase-like domain-containing protein [SAR202 cluster bacterium]|nr:flippase-like domain-containing protein [SAR202 cluster bacterium]